MSGHPTDYIATGAQQETNHQDREYNGSTAYTGGTHSSAHAPTYDSSNPLQYTGQDQQHHQPVSYGSNYQYTAGSQPFHTQQAPPQVYHQHMHPFEQSSSPYQPGLQPYDDPYGQSTGSTSRAFVHADSQTGTLSAWEQSKSPMKARGLAASMVASQGDHQSYDPQYRQQQNAFWQQLWTPGGDQQGLRSPSYSSNPHSSLPAGTPWFAPQVYPSSSTAETAYSPTPQFGEASSQNSQPPMSRIANEVALNVFDTKQYRDKLARQQEGSNTLTANVESSMTNADQGHALGEEPDHSAVANEIFAAQAAVTTAHDDQHQTSGPGKGPFDDPSDDEWWNTGSEAEDDSDNEQAARKKRKAKKMGDLQSQEEDPYKAV